MEGIEKNNDKQISRQNISYYNEIAARYDAILNNDEANKIVRDKVASRFTSLVNEGAVLDFGGGTGQDLDWMLKHNYSIAFCEPSAAMRKIAIDRSKNEFPAVNISFLDDNKTDFRNWNEAFPFEQKMDAVLANFAVINCIPDIELLFNKLALITKPGATLVALFLDTSLKKRLRSNLKGTIKSFFSGDTVSIFIYYNGKRQLVYLHSTRAIKKATSTYFEFNHPEQPGEPGFSLIHLVRK